MFFTITPRARDDALLPATPLSVEERWHVINYMRATFRFPSQVVETAPQASEAVEQTGAVAEARRNRAAGRGTCGTGGGTCGTGRGIRGTDRGINSDGCHNPYNACAPLGVLGVRRAFRGWRGQSRRRREQRFAARYRPADRVVPVPHGHQPDRGGVLRHDAPVVKAQWSKPYYRLAELSTLAFLPFAVVGFLLIYAYGRDELFYWLNPSPEEHLSPWLNSTFLLYRNLFGLALFYGLAVYYAYKGLQPDLAGSGEGSADHRKVEGQLYMLSPWVLLGYVLCNTFFAWDFGMMLVAHWHSTVFPILFWFGNIFAGTAALIVFPALLGGPKSAGSPFGMDQIKSLGMIVTGFTLMWLYFFWGAILRDLVRQPVPRDRAALAADVRPLRAVFLDHDVLLLLHSLRRVHLRLRQALHVDPGPPRHRDQPGHMAVQVPSPWSRCSRRTTPPFSQLGGHRRLRRHGGRLHRRPHRAGKPAADLLPLGTGAQAGTAALSASVVRWRRACSGAAMARRQASQCRKSTGTGVQVAQEDGIGGHAPPDWHTGKGRPVCAKRIEKHTEMHAVHLGKARVRFNVLLFDWKRLPGRRLQRPALRATWASIGGSVTFMALGACRR